MTAQVFDGTPPTLPAVPLHGLYNVLWTRPGRQPQGQTTTNAWHAVEQMRQLVGTEPGTTARLWHCDTGVVLYDSAAGIDRAARCPRCTTPYCADASVHQPDASKRYPWPNAQAWDQPAEEYQLTLLDAAGAAHVAAQLAAAGGAVLRLGAVLCLGYAALTVLAGLPATERMRVELDMGVTCVWVRDGYSAEVPCPVLYVPAKAS